MENVKKTYDVREVSELFCFEGKFVSSELCGRGHINETHIVCFNTKGALKRYILQRINTYVFKDPFRLMENVRRVTEHQHRKLREAGFADTLRRALTLIPAKEGGCCCRHPDGSVWRAYHYIEESENFDTISDPICAYQAARAFGRFQTQLADLSPPRLHETIPDFHNTPRRFEALEKAIEADAFNRASKAREEIAFAVGRKGMTSLLVDKFAQGAIPERITHNDTKMNNVMLDARTREGLCVIDLDTVMPGLALYDFGDMVRSGTNPAAEDEKDLSKVNVDMSLFRALADGYLEATHSILVPAEREYLAFSGRLISFEIGIRFLTDYLSGDVYFRIHRPEHNLDRCRTQFKMTASIEEHEEEMRRYVQSWEPGRSEGLFSPVAGRRSA